MTIFNFLIFFIIYTTYRKKKTRTYRKKFFNFFFTICTTNRKKKFTRIYRKKKMHNWTIFLYMIYIFHGVEAVVERIVGAVQDKCSVPQK